MITSVLTCRLASEDAGGLAMLDLDELHVLQRYIYADRSYVPATGLLPASTPPSPS
jgi:hypothetical protein